jgi:hypothetical protein
MELKFLISWKRYLHCLLMLIFIFLKIELKLKVNLRLIGYVCIFFYNIPSSQRKGWRSGLFSIGWYGFYHVSFFLVWFSTKQIMDPSIVITFYFSPHFFHFHKSKHNLVNTMLYLCILLSPHIKYTVKCLI